MKGYLMLRCFTVEERNGEWVMTCNDFLQWVFDFFFSPFWDGKINILD